MPQDILELVSVSDRRESWEALLRSVSTKLPKVNPDMGRAPLAQIIDLLKKMECSEVLIEHPYRDEDFLSDYLNVHGRCFEDCGRNCARLHFFSGSAFAKDGDLFTSLSQFGTSTKLKKYLGFMVVRPTGRRCVGRTILQYPFSGNQENHIHVRARYKVHICGVTFEVVGTPFMEQDGMSHECASVAAWALGYDLHQRYYTPRLFAHSVSQLAQQQTPRSKTGRGLTTVQLAHVLKHLGCGLDVCEARLRRYNPSKTKKDAVEIALFETRDKRQAVLRALVSDIYGYVESNLPVLICYWMRDAEDENRLSGHVVMAVGHNIAKERVCPDSVAPSESGSELQLNSDHVGCFFVQDDQRGPYVPLRIWKEDKHSAPPIEGWAAAPILEDAESIIIMPGLTNAAQMLLREARSRIAATLEDPESLFANLNTAFQGLGASDREAVFRELKQMLGGTRLSVYLQLSRRFKAQLLDKDHGRTGLSPIHRDTYLKMDLPKVMYVADLYETPSGSDGRFRVAAEMLIDATAGTRSDKSPFLAFRLQEYLIIPGTNELIVADGYTDSPLAPMNRAE